MSLNPWIERDPFHKEGDFPNFDAPQSENEIFSSQRPTPFDTFTTTTTTKPRPDVLADRIDFEPPLLITARPKPSTTKLPTPTTFRPKKTTTAPKRKRTTTVRIPSSTIVDNKLDFGDAPTTKRPDSPFSRLSSPNSTTIVKSKTNKKRRKTRSITDSAFSGDAKPNVTTTTTFTNQDNATQYLNNQPASRLGDFFESRADEIGDDSDETDKTDKTDETVSRYGGDFDHDYDDRDRPYRPTYDYSRPNSYGFYPPYPPLSPSTKRPPAFSNNRPSLHDNTNFIHMRLPSTRQPTQSPYNKHSTPFSYDSFQSSGASISSLSPHFSYNNQAVPLYVSHNRVSLRPAYSPSNYRPTTRRMDLSTFMIVETTRRTTPNTFFDFKRTTERPYSIYQLSHPSKPPSVVILPSFGISGYGSPSPDDDPNISLFASSNTNHIYMKDPIGKPVSPFSYDKHEGEPAYSRPPTNVFSPLKTKKPTYNDYSKYNLKPDTTKPTGNNVKFYYVGNVLHKYFKSDEDDVGVEGLYDRGETKRYAEGYEEHLADRRQDKDETDKTVMSETLTFEGRARKGPENVFLVPFKLLTRIERPDNWVNTDDETMKTRLPEVPALQQDSDVTKELPRPIFSRPARN